MPISQSETRPPEAQPREDRRARGRFAIALTIYLIWVIALGAMAFWFGQKPRTDPASDSSQARRAGSAGAGSVPGLPSASSVVATRSTTTP